jgi:hypothetical protein
MRITAELLEAILAFDPDEEAERIETSGDRPCCLACRGEYRVELGLEPSALCDGCAHVFVDQLAAGLLDVQAKIGKEERYLEKQGNTIAERSYRVGWNDAMRRAVVLFAALAPRIS